MADLNPETSSQVYVDWEYRKVWDSFVLGTSPPVSLCYIYIIVCVCIDLHPIKDKATGLDGLYWCVDYPWPLSDRDVSSTHTHTRGQSSTTA